MKSITKNLLLFLMCAFNYFLIAQNDSVQIDLILNAKKIRSQICFPKIDNRTMNMSIIDSLGTIKCFLYVKQVFDTINSGFVISSGWREIVVMKNKIKTYQIVMPDKIIKNCSILIFEYNGCSYYFKKVDNVFNKFEIFMIKSTQEKEKCGCCDKKLKRKDFNL